MKSQSWRRVLAVPAALAAVSGTGLVLALLYDGWPDLAWSAAVGLPLAVVVWAWRTRKG